MLGKNYEFELKIKELREREKELRCLYQVEEIIKKRPAIEDLFYELLKRIPNGWQYPEICRIKVTFEGTVFKEPNWTETSWKQSAAIVVDDQILGKIEVFYIAFRKMHIDSQFLPQEQKLLNSIASRINDYIFYNRLENTLDILQKEMDSIDKTNTEILSSSSNIHWQWRYEMAEKIAEHLDLSKFGVKGLYIIGSTKNAEAGPASDIDLIFHIHDHDDKTTTLQAWLDGWSLCLAEYNRQKTGYKSDGLLDVHFVTDEDIHKKTSYAVMIGSTENSARPLKTAQ